MCHTKEIGFKRRIKVKNMKEEFYRLLEGVNHAGLRAASKQIADDLPEYFWHVPASSSGKYHPECDLGEGGLVRHSIMVCQIALDLLKTEVILTDSEMNQDMVRVVSLFHDCLKFGLPNSDGSYSEYTVFEHPNLAADFVGKYLEKEISDPCLIQVICEAISSHMGKWNTSEKSDVVLHKPGSKFEKLIHIADYIASRKYIKWKGE